MAYSRDSSADVHDIARSAASKAGDVAETIATKASEKLNDAIASAETTATAVADQGREAGQRVQEVAGNFKGAIDKSVKEQPMATLAVAAAMGLVIGALWKS
jgi:ElaB/YqjD/DUF883 family membrane-anchored ribosome-binding protein